ncbi:MAG: hypothetical protein HYR91_01145 [Flavobacteriia bacterium]|nr:hypothetical protein [Flavobacteriia bacterium]
MNFTKTFGKDILRKTKDETQQEKSMGLHVIILNVGNVFSDECKSRVSDFMIT